MNHLLVVPLSESLPVGFMDSLRQAGWRVSATADPLCAKQLLQKGDVNAVMIEFCSASPNPERLKVLRCVHESCPGALVVMLNSGAESFSGAGESLVKALNILDDTRNEAKPQTLDLYHLSPAQKRIAELVAQAYPNREIARRLKIKEQSVRNELSRIFKKIGVWNRVELALLMRTGQIERSKSTGSISNPWPPEIKPPLEGTSPTLVT